MPPDRLDFSKRADLAELMDQRCSYEEFRACLQDLEKANVATGTYGPTLSWLEQNFAGHSTQPLHIVDVGCGHGDMLRRIQDWARSRSKEVKLTGIDLNPYSAAAAKEAMNGRNAIEWVTGDAFSYQCDAGVDVVISSLFTHHLTHLEIIAFLGWMESTARLGWFVNDLHRHWLPYYYFKFLARVSGWHRFVQNDGPISIRRSFSRADWRELCEEASIPQRAVDIEWHRSFRLCVSRLRTDGGDTRSE
jgi:SAM-dependent methyltransferase